MHGVRCGLDEWPLFPAHSSTAIDAIAKISMPRGRSIKLKFTGWALPCPSRRFAPRVGLVWGSTFASRCMNRQDAGCSCRCQSW